MVKPADLFDRDVEWGELQRFATSNTPGLAIAIVLGRRRAGKSYLLRRLVDGDVRREADARAGTAQGLYYQGIQEEREPALRRVAALVAATSGYKGATANLRFDDWKTALEAMLDAAAVPIKEGSKRTLATGVVVLDEFPYLLQRSPELASVIQLIYDERKAGPRSRLILCGSSISTMAQLSSGSQPLRGRAQVDLRIAAFDFRLARQFWKIKDHATALHVDALLGGSPGYRDLIIDKPPQSLKEFAPWVGATVMNPSHALYREEEFLMREDPRLLDHTLYRSILAAVAAGERTPTRLGGRLNRDRTALAALLNNLVDAGFLRKQSDLGNARAVTYNVADPIVRFSQLVLVPHRARLDERQWREVWQQTESTWKSQILGPHLEDIVHIWLMRYASRRTLGGTAAVVGRRTVADRERKTALELDAVVQDTSGNILLIGEVKSGATKLGVADLHRLERGRTLLSALAARARIMLVAVNGFDAALRKQAALRKDIELVDLQRLYEGT